MSAWYSAAGGPAVPRGATVPFIGIGRCRLRESPAVDSRLMTQVKETLTRLLANEPGLELAYLFGSHSRGAASG